MSIKNVKIRFNLDKENDRKAYEYLQGAEKSYSKAVISAICGYMELSEAKTAEDAFLDPVRFSVKAKHWERAVRLDNIGFSKDRVNAQLRQNAENRYRLFTLEYRPPYKPKKFPLEDELRKLEFSIEHSYDAATVFVDAVFYLVITVIQIVAELADVMLLSPDLRAAEKDLKELVADYHFLQEHGIHTTADLQANIEQSQAYRRKAFSRR